MPQIKLAALEFTLTQSMLTETDGSIWNIQMKKTNLGICSHYQVVQKHTHTRRSQSALREQCWLCVTALLHFRAVNVCLLYDGTHREKRNSCQCLFELWPNPTPSGHVGAPSAPNPSSSCTPSQTHTRTHVLYTLTYLSTTLPHTHNYLSILAISRCVCVSTI